MVPATDWRSLDGVWVQAPGSSHLRRFRPVFFQAGRHAIEIQFEPSGANPKARTYRYWWPDDKNDVGLNSCLNVFEELVRAAEPGKVVWAWLIRARVSVAEI